MKKKNKNHLLTVVLAVSMSILCLLGCENKTNTVAENGYKDSISKMVNSAQLAIPAEGEEPEVPTATVKSEEPTEVTEPVKAEEPAEPVEPVEIEKTVEPKYVKITNPDWEYYYNGPESEKMVSISLKEVSKVSNNVSGFDRWCDEAGFNPPYDWYNFSDDYYNYRLYGEENNGVNWTQFILDINDINTGDLLYTLDFSDFHMPDVIKKGDEFYIDENIHWVTCSDGILYLSIYHNTYAESAPHNGYIMAIDPEDDFKVLWKTEPLTCNTDNFLVTDDALICGYGFTAEDDFVYVLDRQTGKRVQSLKVKTGPDWFNIKDGQLYVYCYDTNYVFDIIEE